MLALRRFKSFPAHFTFKPTSDIDFLIICKKLVRGRLRRIFAFEAIKNNLEKAGYKFCLSPIIKTREEVEMGSPLFFDMTYDVLITYDKKDFFKNYLQGLKSRLKALSARRVNCKNYWYWILKENYTPGEVFTILPI